MCNYRASSGVTRPQDGCGPQGANRRPVLLGHRLGIDHSWLQRSSEVERPEKPNDRMSASLDVCKKKTKNIGFIFSTL